MALQDYVYQVLGIYREILRRAEIEACEAVFGSQALTSRPNIKGQEDIGRILATKLLEASTVTWKDEATKWVQGVCQIWSHRAIYLWSNGKCTIHESNSGPAFPLSIAGGSTPFTAALPSTKISSSAIKRQLQQPRELLPPKRLRPSPKSRGPDPIATGNKDQYHPSSFRQFIYCNIIVILSDELAADESVPPYIIVGISAIISL
jgi:hypothetical protein